MKVPVLLVPSRSRGSVTSGRACVDVSTRRSCSGTITCPFGAPLCLSFPVLRSGTWVRTATERNLGGRKRFPCPLHRPEEVSEGTPEGTPRKTPSLHPPGSWRGGPAPSVILVSCRRTGHPADSGGRSPGRGRTRRRSPLRPRRGHLSDCWDRSRTPPTRPGSPHPVLSPVGDSPLPSGHRSSLRRRFWTRLPTDPV